MESRSARLSWRPLKIEVTALYPVIDTVGRKKKRHGQGTEDPVGRKPDS
jgi:hypothetical protein